MNEERFDFSEFDYMDTPVEWEQKLFQSLDNKKDRKIYKHHRFPVSIAACLIIFFLLSGSAVAIYSVSGGDIFKSFNRILQKDSLLENYSDYDQIEQMTGKNQGVVIDDEDIRVELLGVIYSGKNIQVMVQATIKNMDSLESGEDTGAWWLNNYKFESMEMEEDAVTGGMEYFGIYHDQLSALKPNQLRMMSVYSLEEIIKQGDTHTIALNQFGYVKSTGRFVPTIDKTWTFDIVKDNESNVMKEIKADETLLVSEYEFHMSDINLTPLACDIEFSYTSSKDIADGQHDKFYELIRDIQIVFDDGHVLKDEAGYTISYEGFTIEPKGNEKFRNQVNLLFNTPIDIEKVREVIVNGKSYDFNQ